MKSLVIFSLFCIYSSQCSIPVEVYYFPQIRDHFDNTSVVISTFQQKYFSNIIHYNRSNKLVFLFLGGNGGEQDYYVDGSQIVSSSLWAEIGQKAGALMFYLEHRFYGLSQLFVDTRTDYLQKYLTVEQAMADVVNFAHGRMGVTNGWNLPKDTKWVVFGLGYGGTIATFLRMKYSSVIDYAVVSGSAVKAQLSFDDYLTAVQDTIAAHSNSCLSYIENGLVDLDSTISAGTNFSPIHNAFNLCRNVSTGVVVQANQVPSFFSKIHENFAYAVKFDQVEAICDLIVNGTGDNITRVGVAVNYITTVRGYKDCLDYEFNTTIQELANYTGNYDTSYRPWFFQQCSEFGFFPVPSPINIFKNRTTITYYWQLCQVVFGSNYTLSNIQNKVQQTINNYGEGNSMPNNTLFVYGTQDPWRKLGPNDNTSDVILIEGYGHGSELGPSNDSDSAVLKVAKENIASCILSWFK